MRYLLLLFLSLSAYSKHWKITLIPNTLTDGRMYIEASSDAKLKKKLDDWAKAKKSFKGIWVKNVSGTIGSHEINGEMHYFKPVNFTFLKEDITEQINEEKSVKEQRKLEIKQVKAMIQNINNSNKPAWEKKLLKRLIKEIKE